jgi:membrane protease YdiL (CAAX protease family)
MDPDPGGPVLPPGTRLRLWALLVAGAVLGCLAATPYLAASIEPLLRRSSAAISLSLAVALQTVQVTILSAVFAWLGIACAPRVGLDAPVFRELAEGRARSAARRFASFLPSSALIGLGIGVALSLVLRMFSSRLPPALTSSAGISAQAGAASAFYGGLVEELLLRWGALSGILRLARRLGARDGFWAANAATAVLFGLAHLPLASAAGLASSPAAVWFIIGGNAAAGLVFGWLFRRRGLESAMIAHAAADVWLHAAGPALLHG